jgi:hypothetical protein
LSKQVEGNKYTNKNKYMRNYKKEIWKVFWACEIHSISIN